MLTEIDKCYRRLAIHKARVNVKSLAAEAAIIRCEIAKCRDLIGVASMQGHKKLVLKPESRLAQLVLAFLRGRTRSSTENSPKSEISARKMVEKIRRQATLDVTVEEVENWLKT